MGFGLDGPQLAESGFKDDDPNEMIAVNHCRAASNDMLEVSVRLLTSHGQQTAQLH